MKKFLQAILLSLFCATFFIFTVHAQRRGGGMGGPPSPKFDANMAKIFGDNPAFSATIEFDSGKVTVPGEMAYLDGKTRVEMDVSQTKGTDMPPKAIEQMQAMHMDKMVIISRPDKKITYMAYTGLNGYVENPLNDNSTNNGADYKMDITKVGEETIDGHACIKNKVIITDDTGKTHESTVWNAADLKKFPVRIQMDSQNGGVVMNFKNVNLKKPDASKFEPPANAKKYDDFMQLMMSQHPQR